MYWSIHLERWYEYGWQEVHEVTVNHGRKSLSIEEKLHQCHIFAGLLVIKSVYIVKKWNCCPNHLLSPEEI